MYKRYLVILGIVLVVAFIVSIHNSKTPSPTPSPSPSASPVQVPEPSAAWKIYDGKQYSISYPSYWMIKIDATASAIIIYNPATLMLQQTQYIDISQKSSTQTATQYLDYLVKNSSQYNKGLEEKLLRHTLTISGITAEVIAEQGEGADGYGIYFSTGRDLYYINSSAKSTTSSDLDSQVLATFKLK